MAIFVFYGHSMVEIHNFETIKHGLRNKKRSNGRFFGKKVDFGNFNREFLIARILEAKTVAVFVFFGLCMVGLGNSATICGT